MKELLKAISENNIDNVISILNKIDDINEKYEKDDNEDDLEMHEDDDNEDDLEKYAIVQAVCNYLFNCNTEEEKEIGLNIIQLLIEKGANLNKQYDEGTILNYAINNEGSELLIFLLQNGADINDAGGHQNLLKEAMSNSDYESVDILLEYTKTDEPSDNLKSVLDDERIEETLINLDFRKLEYFHICGFNILDELDSDTSDLALNIVLEEADDSKKIDLIKYLLTIGADVRQSDREDFNAIEKLSKTHNTSPLIKKRINEIFQRYEFIYNMKDIFEEKKLILINCNQPTIKKAIELTDEFYHTYIKLGVEDKPKRKPLFAKLIEAQNYLKEIISMQGILLEFYLHIEELKFEHENKKVIQCVKDRKGNPTDHIDLLGSYIHLTAPIEGFFKLPNYATEEQKIFASITSLLYIKMRYKWKNNYCLILRNIIKKLDPKYKIINNIIEKYADESQKKLILTRKDGSKKKFELALILKESNEEFHGEFLSDNSDSEEENQFQKSSTLQKSMLSAYANKMCFFAGIENLTKTKTKNAAPELKAPKELAKEAGDRSKVFSNEVLKNIHHIQYEPSEINETVHNDLRRLNYLLSSGQLNSSTIKQINTNFYIAQYRGITYRTDLWNKQKRYNHRKANEINHPIYSRSVYQQTGINFTIPYSELTETNKKDLHEYAISILDQLLTLRLSDPIYVNLTKTKIETSAYTYENAGIAIQDKYSKAIVNLHEIIKEQLENFENGKRITNIDELIFTAFNNDVNAFISTGDIPFHALKYAYGIKFYEGEQNKRLRPRYRKNGRPERPYSGKVYVSLHDPIEYAIDGPMHVPSLNETAKTIISEQVVPELEETFPSFIREGKTVAQHLAKFPSFEKEYKEIYLYKYGINKSTFEIFKTKIEETKPHSDERKIVQNLLTLYLCNYHEVCLIEQAKIAAQNKGGILVYRDEFGNFSFYPAKVSHGNKTEYGKAKYQFRDNLREANRNRKDQDGFMNKLLTDYELLAFNYAPNPLVSALYHFADRNTYSTIDEFKSVLENLVIKQEKFLSAKEAYQDSLKYKYNFDMNTLIEKNIRILIAAEEILKANICVHNPRFIGQSFLFEHVLKDINNNNNESKYINLYYAGGNSFSAMLNRDSMEIEKNYGNSLS